MDKVKDAPAIRFPDEKRRADYERFRSDVIIHGLLQVLAQAYSVATISSVCLKGDDVFIIYDLKTEELVDSVNKCIGNYVEHTYGDLFQETDEGRFIFGPVHL